MGLSTEVTDDAGNHKRYQALLSDQSLTNLKNNLESMETAYELFKSAKRQIDLKNVPLLWDDPDFSLCDDDEYLEEFKDILKYAEESVRRGSDDVEEERLAERAVTKLSKELAVMSAALKVFEKIRSGIEWNHLPETGYHDVYRGVTDYEMQNESREFEYRTGKVAQGIKSMAEQVESDMQIDVYGNQGARVLQFCPRNFKGTKMNDVSATKIDNVLEQVPI